MLAYTKSQQGLHMLPSLALRSDANESKMPRQLEDDAFESNMPLSSPRCASKGIGGMNRTRSLFSMSSNSCSSSSTSTESSAFDQAERTSPHNFAIDVGNYTRRSSGTPAFDGGLRKAMDPHLRRARLLREKSRNRTHLNVDASIASSLGVPYISLRRERAFLFDDHTHPLHTILADTLGVKDLSKLHLVEDSDTLLRPLLNRETRHAFHRAFDSFVTSFCVPLLHSLAMSSNILHSGSVDSITYRYQAFPTIRILRPGESGLSPVCDTITGHSIGCLNFHIPLTPSYGTNALFIESHPGREDWHPLNAKSVGLGFLFDGARCLHFDLENTTDVTRVSLDFRIMIFREYDGMIMEDESLCGPEHVIDDKFRAGPGYYDEARVSMARMISPHSGDTVVKQSPHLVQPDERVGSPFV